MHERCIIILEIACVYIPIILYWLFNRGIGKFFASISSLSWGRWVPLPVRVLKIGSLTVFRGPEEIFVHTFQTLQSTIHI